VVAELSAQPRALSPRSGPVVPAADGWPVRDAAARMAELRRRDGSSDATSVRPELLAQRPA